VSRLILRRARLAIEALAASADPVIVDALQAERRAEVPRVQDVDDLRAVAENVLATPAARQRAIRMLVAWMRGL
jgi:hypothetical protein